MGAQTFHVNIASKPLGEALTIVGEASGIMLSFNPGDLNKYVVSADTSFTSGGEAVRYLLAGLPFRIKNINGVTVIAPSYGYKRVSGSVTERNNR